ncbi:cytidylyltransferase domain-containing protein [Malaciobacter sp. WC5094]
MSFAIIIPAQETNKYHKLGDLAPFGDTTLLEWKISQCKEFASSSQIYISSDSEIIEEIAKKEEVNFIKRRKQISYAQIIKDTLFNVKEDIILWTNPTSPFFGFKDYQSMINDFRNDESISSMVSVYSKYDYAYYDKKRLNFGNTFTPRTKLIPIQIVTNGCYIIKKDIAIQNESLYIDSSFLYELDYLSSIEIKDLHTYQISTELISSYFKKDLNV